MSDALARRSIRKQRIISFPRALPVLNDSRAVQTRCCNQCKGQVLNVTLGPEEHNQLCSRLETFVLHSLAVRERKLLTGIPNNTIKKTGKKGENLFLSKHHFSSDRPLSRLARPGKPSESVRNVSPCVCVCVDGRGLSVMHHSVSACNLSVCDF